MADTELEYPHCAGDCVEPVRDAALEAMAHKHGICLDCGELYEHHYTEPFASCKCHCSEWHEMTPHMEAVKKAMEDNLKPPSPLHHPGKFHTVQTPEELEAYFLSRLPFIREAARQCGYAIGLHGSLRRDMDLIAVPWREDCADKDLLAQCISTSATGCARSGPYAWEEKPSGRQATNIPCCWTPWHEVPGMGNIDLSVVSGLAAEPTPAEYDLRKEDVSEGLSLCRMTDLIVKDLKMSREDELLLVPRGALSAVWNALCAARKKDLAECVDHHLKTSAVFPPDWRPMAMSALANWEKGFSANDMANALRLFLNKP